MTNQDAIKWLENLKQDIGKLRHEDLWPYAQAIDEIAELLEKQEAVKPIHKCWNGRFTQLNRINGYAFCPYCGKPIDWGKNVLL